MTRERLRPVYALAGDESWFRDRFREELRARLDPAALDCSYFDEDLATTPLEDILDRARTPSLMAPLQIFWLRNAKELFARGAGRGGEEGGARAAGKKKHGAFPENLEAFARENDGSEPAAVLAFVFDHIHLPSDRQRIGLEDRGRWQRIQEVFGGCGEVVECAQPSPNQALALAGEIAAGLGVSAEPAALRALVELHNAGLAAIARELEKLALHALPERTITAAAVERLVAGSRLGTGFELASALGSRSRPRCLEALGRIWAEEGDSGAIGLVFQLSRAFEMALILRQQRVQDRSELYRVLPEGLRPPGFAADTVLRLGRALPEARLIEGVRRLHAADVALRSNPPSARLVFEELIFALTA